jgi:hypothetical protein
MVYDCTSSSPASSTFALSPCLLFLRRPRPLLPPLPPSSLDPAEPQSAVDRPSGVSLPPFSFAGSGALGAGADGAREEGG